MTSRAAGWALALCVIGCAACGHYGPPVRSDAGREGERVPPRAEGAPSAADPAEQERDRDEP